MTSGKQDTITTLFFKRNLFHGLASRVVNFQKDVDKPGKLGLCPLSECVALLNTCGAVQYPSMQLLLHKCKYKYRSS